jgi:hypothetical protein
MKNTRSLQTTSCTRRQHTGNKKKYHHDQLFKMERWKRKDAPYHRDKRVVAHAAATIEATRACLDQKE